MTKAALVCAVLFVLAGRAMAANSLVLGAKGLSLGFGDSALNHIATPAATDAQNPLVDLSGRAFLSKNVALTGGFGFQMNSGDLKGNYFNFNVGARKYLKIDDFAPFLGVQLSYTTWDGKLKDAAAKYVDASVFDLGIMFGAEYFLGKQFSVEGAVGAALGKASTDINDVSHDSSFFGTRSFGIRGNYYF